MIYWANAKLRLGSLPRPGWRFPRLLRPQVGQQLLHAGDEEADNTDTIMVIRIPNDGKSATAISIPRDTYIHDQVAGNTRINGVYSQ